ncbi:uncharacterized mitochondrial protein AtMg00240-like [Phaseolus vulgaris]|uniref:uncharacterized mitochondrial protein AtMg00240-like n=1 Tax=Phaseolus vulgaris TaxID=3885 RepID=UPI0035CB3433
MVGVAVHAMAQLVPAMRLIPASIHNLLPKSLFSGMLQADKLQNPNPYRRIIGKLLYLTNTRPDITFVVQLLSQFVQEPIVHHQQVVQHVLHYIKANLVHGLFFNSESKVHIKVFSDSDWASSPDTRCSIIM